VNKGAFAPWRKIMKFIKLPYVEELTGFKKSSIYAMMKDGRFPQNIKIGARAVVWNSDSVEQWMQDHIKSSAAND